jgi:Short C-terminal domain
MMRRRRRPLLRGAAMVGGGAALYHAGKKSQAGADHEYEQDAAIQEMAQAPAPPAPAAPAMPAAPAAGGISDDAIAKLKELGQLHDEGILTDAEFDAQKKEILG